MLMYATNFLQTPRSAHPSIEELSPYYSTVKTENIAKTTTLVYSYPWGIRTLRGVIGHEMRMAGAKYGKEQKDFIKQNISYVPNDTLKGDIVLSSMSGVKSFEAYKNLSDVFGEYIISDEQKKRDLALVSSLASYKAGDVAYNFNYPDVNGKMVSMKDLQGKAVFVDVWATWCGPCKKEIPALKKLEEEMRGKNIEFVSISVDEAKDKDKWLKMIKQEQLSGTQLFASGWNDVTKYYKISGIPRFMLFDKNGKIVTVDAPRPSDEKLKDLLEKTLAN
jgi:thiol-disulfide isomerase/thioredoxin